MKKGMTRPGSVRAFATVTKLNEQTEPSELPKTRLSPEVSWNRQNALLEG